MTVAEPVTMLTDYALAVVTLALAWRLWAARDGQACRAWWAGAFVALGLAALLGGSYHGLAPMLGAGTLALLWKATVLSVGCASFAMLAGSALACTRGAARRWLYAFAAVKLAVYAGWMLSHDAFIYVVVDSAVAMLLVFGLHAVPALRHRDAASRWMLGAIALSAIAAGVQASGFALHRHFNHNDLYHVIQIVAMVGFFNAARRLRDRC